MIREVTIDSQVFGHMRPMFEIRGQRRLAFPQYARASYVTLRKAVIG